MINQIYKRVFLFLLMIIAVSVSSTWFSVILLFFACLFVEDYFEGLLISLLIDGSKSPGDMWHVTVLISIVSGILIIISGRVRLLLK
jgi:hypothetical protein